MTNVLTRIRTVLTAIVFWLGVAGAVVAVVLSELAGQVGNPTVASIVGWLLPVATVIATLAAIIRRVTEVIPSQYGLLPESYPVPSKRSSGQVDGGFANNDVVWTLVGILAIVALILYILGRA